MFLDSEVEKGVVSPKGRCRDARLINQKVAFLKLYIAEGVPDSPETVSRSMIATKAERKALRRTSNASRTCRELEELKMKL